MVSVRVRVRAQGYVLGARAQAVAHAVLESSRCCLSAWRTATAPARQWVASATNVTCLLLTCWTHIHGVASALSLSLMLCCCAVDAGVHGPAEPHPDAQRGGPHYHPGDREASLVRPRARLRMSSWAAHVSDEEPPLDLISGLTVAERVQQGSSHRWHRRRAMHAGAAVVS